MAGKKHAASRAERDRARRLRDAVRKGRAVDAADRAWLDRYTAEHAGRGRPLASPITPAAQPPAQPAQPAAQLFPELRGTPAPVEPPPVAVDNPERVPLELPPEPAPLARQPEHERAPIEREHEHASCPVKARDGFCRGCDEAAGGVKCATTGERVYEPMDDDAAEAFGELLFLLVGGGVRLVRPDHAYIEPTPREVEKMTRAMKKIAHRRANALGAVDDLVMGGFAVVTYSRRAYSAPAPKLKPGAS